MSTKQLAVLGRRLWRRIGDGEFLGVRQGEVTLTDHALLELRRWSSPGLAVRKVPPLEERGTGADMDVFVQRTQGHWHRYLIQAKRVNTKGSSPLVAISSRRGSVSLGSASTRSAGS